MREIKFRGKRLYEGGWIYGSLYTYDDNAEIADTSRIGHPFTAVDPATVGQYTGLKDKGMEIYEDDILPVSDGIETRNAVVEFYYGAFVIAGTAADGSGEHIRALVGDFGDFVDSGGAGIIGNRHDNPELLK